MSKIELSTLRLALKDKNYPISVWVKNLSNIDPLSGAKTDDIISAVIFDAVDDNGKERTITIAPTIAPTDILEFITFESLMRASSFNDLIRKKLIEIIDDTEAKELSLTKEPVSQLKVIQDPLKESIKAVDIVISYNKNRYTEAEAMEKILDTTISYNREDLIRASDYLRDSDTDLIQAIGIRLSDFDTQS